MSKWIDASKQKPSGMWNVNHPHLSIEVLIANSCSISIGYYNRTDNTWYVGEPARKEWIDKITHWMPLPINPHFIKPIPLNQALSHILEPLKEYDFQLLEDISKDLISKGVEKNAVGHMLRRGILYLIDEDLKQQDI